MKAILKFDLDEPDDSMDHLRCIKSIDMALVIWEFIYNGKKKIELQLQEEEHKYSGYEVLDMIFDHFTELLNDRNVIIDELIS